MRTCWITSPGSRVWLLPFSCSCSGTWAKSSLREGWIRGACSGCPSSLFCFMLDWLFLVGFCGDVSSSSPSPIRDLQELWFGIYWVSCSFWAWVPSLFGASYAAVATSYPATVGRRGWALPSLVVFQLSCQDFSGRILLRFLDFGEGFQVGEKGIHLAWLLLPFLFRFSLYSYGQPWYRECISGGIPSQRPEEFPVATIKRTVSSELFQEAVSLFQGSGSLT